MSDGMYGARAALYDLLYGFKDYGKEAAELVAILEGEGIPPGARLHDATCGTGNHLAALAAHYRVSGSDLSADMIALAKPKLPDTTLFAADMRDLHLDPPVDVLVSLFSSIGYLTDAASLRAGLAAMYRSVCPGGLVLVEPWFVVESWQDGRPFLQTAETPEIKVARACVSHRDGELSRLAFHWLVARRDAEVEHFVETHHVWMCPRDEMAAAFAEVGFTVRFAPDLLGRGLFIARR